MRERPPTPDDITVETMLERAERIERQRRLEEELTTRKGSGTFRRAVANDP